MPDTPVEESVRYSDITLIALYCTALFVLVAKAHCATAESVHITFLGWLTSPHRESLTAADYEFKSPLSNFA